jgi:hypothetical protein
MAIGGSGNIVRWGAAMSSKRLTAIASSGAEKARIEWGRGQLDYSKPLPPMKLDPKREYKPLRDPRMKEALERAKELREHGSLYE